MALEKRKLARYMRRNPVSAERTLWKLLRSRRFDDLKFRRQVPIGPYVVDFLCLRFRLIVEADGPFHNPGRDAVRDAWLVNQGFRVLRFKNDEVVVWPERVLDAIGDAVGQGSLFQGPLAGEGRASRQF